MIVLAAFTLEEATQTALDAADQIIAALDRIDDDADDEEADAAFTAMGRPTPGRCSASGSRNRSPNQSPS